MKMQMTDSEILANYRQAKDKAAQVTTEEKEEIFSKEDEELIRKTMDDYFASRAEKRRKEAEARLASMDDTEKRSLEKVGLTLGFSPAEVNAMLYSETESNRKAEVFGEAEVILHALLVLRDKTKDDMAREEAEHAARMKRYNSLLSQVEEIMKKRETTTETV